MSTLKVYNSVGNRIRELREEMHMSRVEFYCYLHKENVPTSADSAYRNYEKMVKTWEGKDNVPVDVIRLICKECQCQPDYLFGVIDSKTHDVADIKAVTGLSETSIERLISWNFLPFDHHSGLDVINNILSSDINHLDYFVNLIDVYRIRTSARNNCIPYGFDSKGNTLPYDKLTHDNIVNIQDYFAVNLDIAMFNATRCFSNFLESIYPLNEKARAIKDRNSNEFHYPYKQKQDFPQT